MELINGIVVNEVEKRFVGRAGEKRTPLMGGFELTPYCNLSCKMCLVRESKPGLPVLTGRQWLDIGGQAIQAGTLFGVISGGEPLLHPDFRMIYSGLKKMGMVITINTNGTLIDENMADFLAADMPRRMNITLYGPDEQTYQALCGDGQAFHRVIHAIELLKARNVPIRINIVPNRINYSGVEGMLAICGRYNLPMEMTTYMFEPIRKLTPEKQQYRLSPEERAAAQVMGDAYMLGRNGFLTRKTICYELLQHHQEPDDPGAKSMVHCQAGLCSYWICWNGKMNACVCMTKPQADVEKMGFAAAWEETKKERDGIRVSSKCDGCSLSIFCQNCAAMSLHENGDFGQVPRSACETTMAYVRMMANGIEKRMERRDEDQEKP